jgi:hypothetical protein
MHYDDVISNSSSQKDSSIGNRTLSSFDRRLLIATANVELTVPPIVSVIAGTDIPKR